MAGTSTDHARAIRENVRLISQHIDEFDMAFAEEHLNDVIAWADALAARVERLQRLWQAWQRAGGGQPRSHAYGAFLDALKACEDHGDLLPVEDGQ